MINDIALTVKSLLTEKIEQYLNTFTAWLGLCKQNPSHAHLHTRQGTRHPFYATRKTRPKIQGERSTLYLWPFKSVPHILFLLGRGWGCTRFVDSGEQNLIWCCQNRAEFLKGVLLAVGKLSGHTTKAFPNRPRGSIVLRPGVYSLVE